MLRFNNIVNTTAQGKKQHKRQKKSSKNASSFKWEEIQSADCHGIEAGGEEEKKAIETQKPQWTMVTKTLCRRPGARRATLKNDI